MSPLAAFKRLIPVRRGLGVTQVAMIVALFLTVVGNGALWQALWKILGPVTFDNVKIFASLLIVVFFALTVLLSLFGFKYLFKPVLAALLLTAALVSYFMTTYGTVIDRSMIQNVFETDVREATELFSFGLLWHLLLFGLFPAWCVFRTKIHYDGFFREFGKRCLLLVASLVVIGGTVFASYKDLSMIIRDHRQLRVLVNPTYPVYALATYARTLVSKQDKELLPLAKSVAQAPPWQQREKQRVVIFVLGETARAADFSLDGYGRKTNPLLSQTDILNFTQVSSCATATADSVPCIFSGMQRENFNNNKAHHTQNLFDLLNQAGVRVLWRDNNSGSKGVTDRVGMEDISQIKVEGLCNDEECFDEILLHNLQASVDRTPGDLFLVLHQKGSHGPLYYKRVPDSFRKFTPECRQDEVQKCSKEEIVNSYDNTILYTDYFLAKTLDFLKVNEERYETALLYMSDHGESLGENGIYLHGAPYVFAPDGQTHIPFLAWMSPGFADDAGVDLSALRKKTDEPYSHDNLFHTVLGLFDIQTEIYRSDLDLFSSVRKPHTIPVAVK